MHEAQCGRCGTSPLDIAVLEGSTRIGLERTPSLGAPWRLERFPESLPSVRTQAQEGEEVSKVCETLRLCSLIVRQRFAPILPVEKLLQSAVNTFGQ
jgi:hypothetical protein